MNLQKKTAVVTGVAGFPGGHLSVEPLSAGGNGHDLEHSEGGVGFEFIHHDVKVNRVDAVLARSLQKLGGTAAICRSNFPFGGVFSRLSANPCLMRRVVC